MAPGEPDPTYGATVDTYNDGNMILNGETLAADEQWFSPINYLTSPLTILDLEPQISNQKPFHISLAADKFHNAEKMLLDFENTIRARSNTLFNEGWTDGLARDDFMQRGPGRLLAYIANWRAALIENEKALRNLIAPIDDAMAKMDQYIKEYREKAKNTTVENLGFWEKFSTYGNNDGGQDLLDMVEEKKDALAKEYDQKARQLAQDLASAYWTAFLRMQRAVGASYTAPNVIATAPGTEMPWFNMGVPGFGGLGPGGPTVNMNAVPQVQVGLNQQQLQKLQNGIPNVKNPPAGPNVDVPGLGPGGPQGGPANPPTVGTGPGAGPGGFPGAFPPGAGPLTRGTAPRVTTPSLNGVPGAGAGVTGPGGLGNGAMPPPGLGRGISRGVLGNPNGRAGMLPPGRGLGKRQTDRQGTLRSPGANYTSTGEGGPGGVPGGSGSRMPPPVGGGAGRRQYNRSSGVPTFTAGAGPVPEQFARSGMQSPVSPVLGRASQQKRRQQGTEALGAPLGMRGTFAPPTATPPVLDAASARTAGGSTLPPPAGMPPQRRTRRPEQRARGLGRLLGGGGPDVPSSMPGMPGGMGSNRRNGKYTEGAGPNLVGNPDWLAETGPDESASTAPVLRNQMAAGPETAEAGWMPPQPGSTSPVLNQSSRAAVRQATTQNRSRPGGQRGEQSETELARRAREVDHHGRSTAEAEEVRAGEEAFTVQTPGGSVVGGTQATPEAAPRPTIGNT